MTTNYRSGGKRQHLTAATRNWRFSASYDSFVVNQTFVLRMNICGENRQLLVAANRYVQLLPMRNFHILLIILLIQRCTKTLDYNTVIYKSAVKFYNNQQFDSTKNILIKASTSCQLSDSALHYLALSYYQIGNVDSAIYYLTQAVNKNKEFEIGYYNLGIMYDSKGIQTQALENYEKAILIDPDSKSAIYNKATILYKLTEYNDALKLCQRAIAIDSSYILPFYLTGQIYKVQNKLDSSLLYNQLLIKRSPNDPEYLFHLAISELDNGLKNEAIKHFSKSINILTENNPSYFNRATLYQQQGQFAEAKKDYLKFISTKPHDNESYVRLSWIYTKQNKLDSTRIILETALAMDSTYSDTFLYLGDYYSQTNKNKKACDMYLKAKNLNNIKAIDRIKQRCNN